MTENVTPDPEQAQPEEFDFSFRLPGDHPGGGELPLRPGRELRPGLQRDGRLTSRPSARNRTPNSPNSPKPPEQEPREMRE